MTINVNITKGAGAAGAAGALAQAGGPRFPAPALLLYIGRTVYWVHNERNLAQKRTGVWGDRMRIVHFSDLHIGGPGWKQIFNQGELLAAFIRSRAKGAVKRRVALVINGDTVDFIADRNAKYFDPEGAIAKLDAIMDDENFADVFNALSEFIAKQNRYLVITLGNHDLELALPWVREHFKKRLSQGDDAARGRITLAFDGTGYTARVADKSVICVHGNEFDEWNVCDYETLRRQGRDLHRGR